MPNVLIESSTMEEIGNAIRKKTGTVDKIYPNDMPEAIGRIESGEFLTKEEADKKYAPIDSPEFVSKLSIQPSIWEIPFSITDNFTEITIESPWDANFHISHGHSGLLFLASDGGAFIQSSMCTFERWDGEKFAPIKVTGIATPTDPNDAVNKKYIDTLVGDINTVLDQINGEVV